MEKDLKRFTFILLRKKSNSVIENVLKNLIFIFYKKIKR